jgi:hypothetical protein
MNVFQSIPELWKLPSLAFPTGIIAGGAPRDFLLGAPPRDIDIFVPDAREVREAIAVLGAEPVLKYGEYEVNYNRSSAYILEQPGGLPLNIVLVRGELDPKALIDDFDFGICRVAWSARQGFRINDPFFIDAAAKRFTFLSGPKYTERSRRRYKDFVKRPHFAGWPLIGLSLEAPARKIKEAVSDRPITGRQSQDVTRRRTIRKGAAQCCPACGRRPASPRKP